MIKLQILKVTWVIILFKLPKEKFLFHQIIGIVSEKIKLKVNFKQGLKKLKLIIILILNKKSI